MPVAESDVRFAANEIPHGPANAVISGDIWIQSLFARGGKLLLAGWPESILLLSGIGPCGVIIFGE
jgi:hypothetical protein